jgi:hypothetical protein
MPLSRYSGTFEPEDLEFLQRVFDKVAKQRGLSSDDTEKAEKLAAEIVLLFSQGAVREADLMRGLAQCGDRPPMLVTIRRIGDGSSRSIGRRNRMPSPSEFLCPAVRACEYIATPSKKILPASELRTWH